jgi:hypothetical protein
MAPVNYKLASLTKTLALKTCSTVRQSLCQLLHSGAVSLNTCEVQRKNDFDAEDFDRISSAKANRLVNAVQDRKASTSGRSNDNKHFAAITNRCSSSSSSSTSRVNTNGKYYRKNDSPRSYASDVSLNAATAGKASERAEYDDDDDEDADDDYSDGGYNDDDDDQSGITKKSSGKNNKRSANAIATAEFRGNKGGRLSTSNISKSNQTQRESKFKPRVDFKILEKMTCEQLLDEIKERFAQKKRPYLGQGFEKDSKRPVEIKGFEHEISSKLRTFLGFDENERGVKASRRFVDRRLKSYLETMNLFVDDDDFDSSNSSKDNKPRRGGGLNIQKHSAKNRVFLLDNTLKELLQTPQGVDKLAFRRRTKADYNNNDRDDDYDDVDEEEEERGSKDGVIIPAVSTFLDKHFMDISGIDPSTLSKVQRKVVVKNNRVFAVRESSLKILLQKVRTSKDVQFALEAVALFHMERAAEGKTQGLGFERAYEFIKACCDVNSYETALWACEQSRSLGLNLSRKTLSLLLWHLIDKNRPLEEVLRVYSVTRNLKLGIDAKIAQFVVKSALMHGHVNAAGGYCVQFMKAGVKLNRKTPTAVMNAAIENNFPKAAIVVEQNWNVEIPQLPKAPFDRLALAQAYALISDQNLEDCSREAKDILKTLKDFEPAIAQDLRESVSQKLALWPKKLVSSARFDDKVLKRCKAGMLAIKNACPEIFADVNIDYCFQGIGTTDDAEEEEEEEEEVANESESK